VSGDHENTLKTRKNGESNFHLKRGSRPGPTKQSGAFPAERGHRGSLPVTARDNKGLNLFNKTISEIVYKCLVPASLRDLLASILRQPQLMVL